MMLRFLFLIIVVLGGCKQRMNTSEDSSHVASYSSQQNLYVDLDGVLTDFVGNYLQVFHRPFYNPNDSEGTRDQSWLDKSWQDIDRGGMSYWANMKKTADADALWIYIKKLQPAVLSGCGKNPSTGCAAGKVQWVKKNLSSTVTAFIEQDKSSKCIPPHSILIDDQVSNIEPWVKKGCRGILHTSAKDTIKQLQNYGL